ncbi:MAG: ABC transporter substrate-binding protein [Spirochaetales bacterium]|nr:ABC transporter substrate-binding protein [Spirochaetales bacterium]
MKRLLLIVLMSSTLVSVLFAAGAQEEAASEGPVTIQLGISTREVGAAMPELLKSFEAANPNIKVEWNKVPGVPNDQHTLYVTNMMAQSEQPDVMAVDVVWPGEFIANGWAEPLNEYFSDSDLEGYLDGMMNSVTLDGKAYGVPLYTNAIHFFYRKDLLDKYGLEKPDTWEELIESAMFITEKEQNPDLNGYISMWAQIEGLFMNYLQFMWGAGGQFFDTKGNPSVNTPEAVKALETMVDMIYKYNVAPESILTYKPNDAMALFRQGRAVFMVVQDFVWPMLNEADSPVKGKVVMDRVPYFEGHSDANTVCMGGWILTLNPYSEHKAEAAELIRHLTSTESGIVLGTKSGCMPAVKGMEENAELISAYPIAETLYKDFSVGDVRPSAQAGKNYPELSHIMQKEIHAALLQKKSPAQAMADAQKALDELLQ